MKILHALALICLLACSSTALANDVAVKITKRAPEQTLGSDGLPNGVTMSTPGTSMTFVRMSDDQVVLKGADGALVMIGVAGTDYAPPAPATPAVSSVPSAPPVTTAPAAIPVQPPAGDDTAKKLSAAFGQPLFSDAHFWSDDVAEVAKRFPSSQFTSKTGNEVFYDVIRGIGKPPRVFNCPCFGMGLEGKDGNPTYVTLLFLNVVQSPETQNRLSPTEDEIKTVNDTVSANIAADQQTISDALTAILGQPTERDAGPVGDNRREVRRWNWKDVAFLLSCRKGGYIFMEIMPAKEADRIESGSAPTPVDSDEFVKRVAHAANGDVTLNDVPDACESPAAGYNDMTQWQRVLHYMEVPGDAYILGVMEAHSFTKVGTNWSCKTARPALNDYLSAYHCHAEALKDAVSVDLVASSIDRGLPMIWTGFISGEDEQNAHAHTTTHQGPFDVATYTAQLEKDDLDRGRIKGTPQPPDLDAGSLLVVGYNKDTQEIAIKELPANGLNPLMWITIRTMKRIAPQGLRRLSWEGEN
jgi:hypothetical protein